MRVGHRQPLVSVVIPCFNAASTLASTLDSARRQTVSEIEIIVVDDGSSDVSATIAARTAIADPRVRIITQANAGVSATRNTGIRAANARVIALLDADDLWQPDHVATHLKRITDDLCLGISYSPAVFVDVDGHPAGRSNPKLTGLTPADFLCANPTTTCSTLVIRRDVFKDVGYFHTHMRYNEDQEWLFRASLSGWVIAGDPTPRVSYRINPNGLAADLDAMFDGFETMLREAAKGAPRLVARHRARATASMQRYLARRAIRLGLPPAIARRYAFAALLSDPCLVVREPRQMLTTLGASLLPRPIVESVLAALKPTPVLA